MSEFVIKKSCENCLFYTDFEREECTHPAVVGEKTHYFDGIGYREFYREFCGDRATVYKDGHLVGYDPPVPVWCPFNKDKKLTLVFEP